MHTLVISRLTSGQDSLLVSLLRHASSFARSTLALPSIVYRVDDSSTSSTASFTDACVEGYAAVCGTEWFHATWTEEQQRLAQDDDMSRDSMPWKELYAIVAAAATWGSKWARRRVLFFTDCMPVVHALAKGASRTRRIMQLIRLLHHYAATHHFVYRVQHIPGVENDIADELSRVHAVSQLSTRCRSSIDPSPITTVLPRIQA